MRIRGRTLAAAGIGVATALLLSSCSHQAIPQDTFNYAGPAAKTEARLFWAVFFIAVFVFVLVEGLLVVAMAKFRHRPGRRPVQTHGNRRLELGWTLAPAIILAAIAFPTVGTIFSLARHPANALNVTVTGHQWWWEVQYPSLKVVTANEVHIPAGQPVLVKLESKDVIHSFWVPRLAGKQDLEPGRTNYVTIEAYHPGTYLGQCAEFCGTSHANMHLKVIADTPADFQAWASQQAQSVPPPPAGSQAAQGQNLFENGTFLNGLKCVACHTNQAGIGGTIGPNLSHFGSRTSFAGSTFDNTPDELDRWLANAPAKKPGVDMPYLGLNQTDIRALIAYLEYLK